MLEQADVEYYECGEEDLPNPKLYRKAVSLSTL
jgi:hypothetical protein